RALRSRNYFESAVLKCEVELSRHFGIHRRLSSTVARQKGPLMMYNVRCVGCKSVSIIPAEWIDHPWHCPQCGLTAFPQHVVRVPDSVKQPRKRTGSLIPLLGAWMLSLVGVAFAG